MADVRSAHPRPDSQTPEGQEAYATKRLTELRQLLENGEIQVNEVLRVLAEINFYIERYQWNDYDAQLLANYNFASTCLSIRSEQGELISEFTRDFVVNGVRACEVRISENIRRSQEQKTRLGRFDPLAHTLKTQPPASQSEPSVTVELELLETAKDNQPTKTVKESHQTRGANSEIGFMHRIRYPGHRT